MFRSRRQKYIVIALAVLVVGAGATITRALLLGNGGGPVSSSDIELQRGLVGWWKMDGNARDATPYANNGTLTGGPTGTTDRHGAANSALSFNGTNQYVALPAGGLPTSAITVSLWVNQSTLVNYYDLAANNWTSEGSWDLYTLGNGQVLFGVFHSGLQYNSACSTGTMTINSWHHLVGTYDGSTVKVYFDGNVCSTTKSVSGVTLHNTGNWTVGEHAAGSSTHSIDDVRIYNRALSAAEVSVLYGTYNSSVALGAGENGLIGWWRMNGNGKDSTPFNHDATISGATLAVDRKNTASSAYIFDGASSYLQVNGVKFTFPMSVSLWFKANTTNTLGHMIYAGENTNGDGFGGQNECHLSQSNTNLQFYCQTGGTVNFSQSTPVITNNNWHHVVVVLDTTTKIYVDGAQKISTAVTGTPNFSNYANWIYFGRPMASSRYFNGSLDDIRIYNRDLSASEVSSLYNTYDSQIPLYSATSSGGSINLSSGLISEWDFNGNARDATPYGNNGTVNGATLTADRKGRANSAYQLGDSGAWIGVGSPSIYSNLPAGFTYNIWLMRTTSSIYHWPEIMGSSNTHTYFGIRSQNFGDSIGLEYGTTPYAGSTFASTSGQTLPVNQWHMFTVTYDGATLRSYWDSALKSTTTVALNPSFGGLNFTGATNAWNGSIDDARVWNRALSQVEVADLYSIYR
ncbi:MAG TPA: LamG domain-containing protein [Candidatus Saccharimonadales bacterium]|nr:LamG domain-containing protein [Candidatus Saccharimonadales bacterium]